MSKQSGLGDNFYISGYDLSGDVGSLGSISAPLATLDVTGIDKEAMERIAGQRGASMSWSSFFNPTAGAAHPVLSALPRTDVLATYCRGTALGSVAACMPGKQVGYDPTRGNDGSLTMAVEVQGSGYGVEWGRLLTAGIRTDTDETDGASIDTAGSVSHGLQAYLHVFDTQGTDVTVKLQGSANDIAWSDIAGGDFSALSGASDHVVERIATSATEAIPRYLRVITTTSAGFTSCSFAVVVVKNKVAVSF